MAASTSVQQSNCELARKVNDEAKANPSSPYSGKFVGIAHGQVVVVADTWGELSQQLRRIEPDPSNCFCLEASADYDAVHEIWSAA